MTLARSDGAVSHHKGKRLCLGGGDGDGNTDPVDHAILKGNVVERTVATPNMPKGQAHDSIGILKAAVLDENIARCLADACPHIAIV